MAAQEDDEARWAADHPSEALVALVCDGEVVEVFSTYIDALRSGLAKFGYSDKFSLRSVDRRAA